ncbi:MAG: hypothetical protein AB7G12_13330 [Thermoanaerobaculia bacterium]
MTRNLFRLATASAASAALFALLPASTAHPLRAMVCLLPLAAWLVDLASRSRAARWRPLEPALWALWALLALGHGTLGIDGAAVWVASAGFLLAAARLLFVARALGEEASGARPAVIAFAAAFGFLLFLWPWSIAGRAPDGDEPYYLLLTRSLAHDFDVDLANQYADGSWREFARAPVGPQPGDPTGAHGERWSRHAALLPLLLAPLYAAGGLRAAELGMVALSAAFAALLFAAIRRRRDGRAAAAIWSLALLAPPLFVYSGRFWAEIPAALAVAVVIAFLPAAGVRTNDPARWRAESFALVAALVALPLLKLRFLLLSLPLALLAWRRLASRSARLRVALPAAIGIATGALLLWNRFRFGNPFRMYGAGELDLLALPPLELLRGLAGPFFDVAFGLFAWAPLWLLLFPAFLRSWRRHELPAGELLAAAPYVAFLASRHEWYGGWSPPFRYGLVLLPILALLLSGLDFERPRPLAARLGLAALAGTTALVALFAFVEPAWTFSLADGTSRLLGELTTRIPADLARFTPSLVRPRPATWFWLVAAPLVVTVAWRERGRSRGRVAAPAFAAALLLAGAAGWVLAAERLPTSRVEAEDAWVAKSGGALHPERWTVDRASQTGGWTLVDGSSLRFVPVTDGRARVVRLRGYFHGDPQRPLALELSTGGSEVARLAPGRVGEWTTVESAPLDLPRGAALEIRARQSDGGTSASDGSVPFFIVDFVELVRP